MTRLLSSKYLVKYRYQLYCAVIATLVTIIVIQEIQRCRSYVKSKHMTSTTPNVSSMTSLQMKESNNTCNPSMRRQIILLTYGRSGSTLTTEIIQQVKQVYTYFEPLHNLAKSFEKQQNLYKQKWKQYLPLTTIQDYMKQALNIVEKLMTCDYKELPNLAATNTHMRLYDSAQMFHCLKRSKTLEGQGLCLKDGRIKCLQKSIHFMKIIRLTTGSIGQLMSRYPCLKMVYLVRDPRGTFLSKKRAFNNISGNITLEAEKFCRRLDKDVEDALLLLVRYPDRVVITRYEDIAENPLATSWKLYRFLGLNFTQESRQFITNVTHSNVNSSDIYSTLRSNSTEVSYAWRSKMKFSEAVEFDTRCREVYYKLGYVPVNTELHLRDRNNPLKFHKEFLL